MLLWGSFGLVLAITAADAILALRRRQSLLALVAIMGALIAPVALLQATGQDLGLAWLSAAYLAVSVALIWWRTRLGSWGDEAGVAGYSLALLTTLLLAIFAGTNTLALIALAVAVLLYQISRLEKQGQITFLVVVCVYLGLAQLVPIRQWPPSAYAALMLLAGAASYTLGFIRRDSDPVRAQAFRHSGLIGPFLGLLLGLTAGASQAPILALGTGSVLLWTEAYLQGSRLHQEMAGALLLVTLGWLLSYSGITEVQAYSLPWAAYFAYLAAKHPAGAGRTTHYVLIVLALASFTLPVAVQTLSGNLFYGLELVFLGLALMVAGSSQLNRLVLWWGGGTAALTALYVLPKFLAPNTQTSTIAPLLGLVVFAIAVITDQARRPEDD